MPASSPVVCRLVRAFCQRRARFQPGPCGDSPGRARVADHQVLFVSRGGFAQVVDSVDFEQAAGRRHARLDDEDVAGLLAAMRAHYGARTDRRLEGARGFGNEVNVLSSGGQTACLERERECLGGVRFGASDARRTIVPMPKPERDREQRQRPQRGTKALELPRRAHAGGLGRRYQEPTKGPTNPAPFRCTIANPVATRAQPSWYPQV
jgi:hypothetical protein